MCKSWDESPSKSKDTNYCHVTLCYFIISHEYEWEQVIKSWRNIKTNLLAYSSTGVKCNLRTNTEQKQTSCNILKNVVLKWFYTKEYFIMLILWIIGEMVSHWVFTLYYLQKHKQWNITNNFVKESGFWN